MYFTSMLLSIYSYNVTYQIYFILVNNLKIRGVIFTGLKFLQIQEMQELVEGQEKNFRRL